MTAARLDPRAESYDLDDESLAPVAIPITYKGRRYELREADADAALRWRSATVAKMTPGPAGGLVPSAGFHDNEAFIVHLCLWDVTESAAGKQVPLATVRKWPYRFLEPLSERAKQISGITIEDDTIEKLEAAIAELQEKLAKLREKEAKKREAEADGQTRADDPYHEDDSPEGNGGGGTTGR